MNSSGSLIDWLTRGPTDGSLLFFLYLAGHLACPRRSSHQRESGTEFNYYSDSISASGVAQRLWSRATCGSSSQHRISADERRAGECAIGSPNCELVQVIRLTRLSLGRAGPSPKPLIGLLRVYVSIIICTNTLTLRASSDR